MKFYRVVIFICAILVSSTASADPADELMETWLNIESQRGLLTQNWNERRQQLDQKLKLLEAEQQTLKEFLAEANQDTGAVDVRRRELADNQQALEQEESATASALDLAINQLTLLLGRMPPPLYAEWRKPLADLSDTTLKLSEKLEKFLGIAKSIEQFNGRIAIHKTPMTLTAADDAAREMMVTQIYIGLSQGWYVSENGEYFGYGNSSASGWQWQHRNNRSPESGDVPVDPDRLLAIVEMIESPTKARFVTLPIKL